MKNPICAASRERADELLAAGCPIDFPGSLPCNSFRVEPLPGYFCGRVYELGQLDTGYVIPLRLTSDRLSGTIITGWNFKPPWQGQDIDWNCEPEDFIPKKGLDEYRGLFKSPLMNVLNHGLKLRYGHPVEGLLCGRSSQPIGESSYGFTSARLIVTDDRGNTVPLCFDLNVEPLRNASTNQLPVGRTRPRVFVDHPEFGAPDQGVKPEETLPAERKMLEMPEAVSGSETIHTVHTRLTDAGQ
jgi:hypothetical protein